MADSTKAEMGKPTEFIARVGKKYLFGGVMEKNLVSRI